MYMCVYLQQQKKAGIKNTPGHLYKNPLLHIQEPLGDDEFPPLCFFFLLLLFSIVYVCVCVCLPSFFSFYYSACGLSQGQIGQHTPSQL